MTVFKVQAGLQKKNTFKLPIQVSLIVPPQLNVTIAHFWFLNVPLCWCFSDICTVNFGICLLHLSHFTVMRKDMKTCGWFVKKRSYKTSVCVTSPALQLSQLLLLPRLSECFHFDLL